MRRLAVFPDKVRPSWAARRLDAPRASVGLVDDWLGGARFEGGALLIPGRPSSQAADLVFTPDRVEVRWQRLAVDLPWDRFDRWPAADRSGGGWGVVGNKARKGPRGGDPPQGAAIRVTGELRERTTDVVNRLPRGWPPVLYRTLRSLRESDLLALNARRGTDERDQASRSTVAVLAAILAARPELRRRLADRERMRRLAVDLSAHACVYADPGPPDGIRRQTMEIGTAMRALGFRHPFGRPIPGDPLLPLDDAVAHVVGYIAANPHAAGVEIDRERVRIFVDRRYLGVPPWPFEALTV